MFKKNIHFQIEKLQFWEILQVMTFNYLSDLKLIIS